MGKARFGTGPDGALTKTHLEHCDIAVEELLQVLRFDQREKISRTSQRTIARMFGMVY